MKIIIHDLHEDIWQELELHLQEDDVVICREKTHNIGELLSNCCQLVLISRCVYGGFSPFIQSVLEQCKSYLGPLMELRNGKTHYEVKRESKNTFGMVCCFYGTDITPGEEQSARILSVSNGISLQARGVKVLFYDSIEKIKQLSGISIN